MSAHAPPRLALANAVLAWETQQRATGADVAPAIESAFARLHGVMFKLVGSAGYRALLMRAVHLATHEHAWLEGMAISTPPLAIVRLDEQVKQVGPEEALNGAASLLAILLDLFCAFIGEELTLRQVHQVWSAVPSGAAAANPAKEAK